MRSRPLFREQQRSAGIEEKEKEGKFCRGRRRQCCWRNGSAAPLSLAPSGTAMHGKSPGASPCRQTLTQFCSHHSRAQRSEVAEGRLSRLARAGSKHDIMCRSESTEHGAPTNVTVGSGLESGASVQRGEWAVER